ncbi:MAG: FadR family transcriptional regulator [Spirochaetaceae bacterium]|nr:MAG: FadR family transcriptional regulator [Spirochaetaceae bacterium]
MSSQELIDRFEKIDLPDPVDVVIQQIKDLIHSGVLKPGDRLPSEKKIEEKLGIPRGPINRAFRRLETYGILKTVPQSGTYVARIGVDALEGLLANVLKLEDQDFQALIDTRRVLEVYAAELVAQHATDEEIRELEELQKSIAEKIKNGVTSFDEDMVFHLKIAEFSKNPVLKSILTLLISEVIQQFKDFEASIGRERVLKRLLQAIQEHQAVIAAICKRNPTDAAESMQLHFQRSNEYRDQAMRRKSGT